MRVKYTVGIAALVLAASIQLASAAIVDPNGWTNIATGDSDLIKMTQTIELEANKTYDYTISGGLYGMLPGVWLSVVGGPWIFGAHSGSYSTYSGIEYSFVNPLASPAFTVSGSFLSSSIGLTALGTLKLQVELANGASFTNLQITEHQIASVPGPVAGAGIPALLALGGFAFWRHRREQAVAA